MKNLRSINNQLYIYEGFEEDVNLHKCSEVSIDDEGNICALLILNYFTDEELSHDDISWITLTQWYELVRTFIRYYYYDTLDEEEILNATEDIVNRAFRYGIPKMHELYDYINDHLDR